MKINRSEEEISEKELPIESVLVLQGGGSLGAYECGVYKTLARHSIKFDIVSSSIGALNTAIIAAHSYDSVKDSTEKLKIFG
jgi:predicted acylesterase/phospholipase RssA